MSNIYHLEPPTKGKVVLHTSMGDVDVELWAREVSWCSRSS
jgi:peptidyl-prolyl cis-trans isomerase SDCCAG10